MWWFLGNIDANYVAIDVFFADSCGYMTHAVQKMADWYFHNGSPIQAACCHLVINDHKVFLGLSATDITELFALSTCKTIWHFIECISLYDGL